MKKIFVSGCYDILHANHIALFEKAKSFGDYLIVSFASDAVLMKYKNRKSAIPENHKKYILESLTVVDEVVMGSNLENPIFDFKDEFERVKPDVLVITTDDLHFEEKRDFCVERNCSIIAIPRVEDFGYFPTTQIRNAVTTPIEVPLRVDFGGGWLDVPKYAKKGAYIVNCTITSKVSLTHWPYEHGGGLGGSAAWAILNGKDGVQSELELGVGWQDPAVIKETGLCVWRSGSRPVLEEKLNPDFLKGKLALYWTGEKHDTPSNVDNERNFEIIEQAGYLAKQRCYDMAMDFSYRAQLDEGMKELPNFGEIAKKYCGGGWGGYALYLFDVRPNHKDLLPIEPYLNENL